MQYFVFWLETTQKILSQPSDVCKTNDNKRKILQRKHDKKCSVYATFNQNKRLIFKT